MNVLIIPDLHGKDLWKELIAETTPNKVVFLGDYFDNSGLQAEEEAENFKEILALKERNPANINLLLGNCDFHYLKQIRRRHASFNPRGLELFQPLLENAIERGLLKICHQERDVIFSHAGIHSNWCELAGLDTKDLDLANIINRILYSSKKEILSDNFSPLYLDSIDLVEGAGSIGYDQVVGHTLQYSVDFNFIETSDGKSRTVVFTDTLDDDCSYLLWNIEQPLSECEELTRVLYSDK